MKKKTKKQYRYRSNCGHAHRCRDGAFGARAAEAVAHPPIFPGAPNNQVNIKFQKKKKKKDAPTHHLNDLCRLRWICRANLSADFHVAQTTVYEALYLYADAFEIVDQ
jgi:hypothetical protein